MTQAQYEQKIFWRMFEKRLNELGNPFHICCEMGGETKYFASVNKNNARVSLGLTIDFLFKEEHVKINIYIENNIPLFERLYSQKEEIEKELQFTPKWILSGTKNPNTRRIISTFPIKIGNPYDYGIVIDKVIPYIVRYQEVFKKRIPNLFDFDTSKTSVFNEWLNK